LTCAFRPRALNIITSLSNLTSLGFESGVAIDEFSSDGTLGDDSNTAVPTESAVKTYVDTIAVTKSPLLNPAFSETVSISNTDAQENAFEVILNSNLVASITAEGVTSIPEILVSNDSFLARTYETVDVIANASGIVPLNQSQTGSVFYFTTPAGNFTCNFDNIDTSVNRSVSYAVVINQGATAYMPTGVQVNNSPVTIKWLGGTGTPLGNSNQVDVIGFTIIVINNAVAQVIANAASYA
jgi:hypothetical protein